jgi:hexosaminidase
MTCPQPISFRCNSVSTALAFCIAFLVATASSINAQTLFSDNFDSYAIPVTVTNAVTTNGYVIRTTAAFGPQDFKAIFGFDYSTISYPTNIPSAPHAAGTKKALYLTANKDGIGAVAAVNLYPTNQSFSGNYMLQFDLWMNYGKVSSTEHVLFGINHSGLFTNQITIEGSDGMFFAVDGDGGASATSASARDYSVLQAGGPSLAPVLLTTANTSFTGLLGVNFDNADNGFKTNFPIENVNGFATVVGSCGMRWVNVQVMQKDSIITWMLNSNTVAQYTNITPYTAGDIMIGYNDTFASIGDSNNFALIDNIVVSPLTPSIVSQPQSQTVNTNTTVVFSVLATSNAPLTYIWMGHSTNMVDGGRIGGSHTSSLTIANTTLGDSGPYQVIVSNSAGSVTSVVATLTVLAQVPETVTWTTPSAITYGTALSSNQLNATATVPGTFNYNYAPGTVLGAGSYALSVLFTPTDMTRYTNATVAVPLTVSPAVLNVTAANASRPFGLPNPPFSGSIVGLQNGDNIGAAYACGATAGSPAGVYQIVPALVDPANRHTNYTVNLFNGMLTISAGTSLVTASATTIIPLPVSVTNRPGVFVLCPSQTTIPAPAHAMMNILVDGASLQSGQFLANALSKATGYQFRLATSAETNAVRNAILITTSNALSTLGTEGYELTVAPDSVVIRAAGQSGTFYGVQSLMELLPPQVFSPRPVSGIAWAAPCIYVRDQPSFSWRGVMLDPARHFISKQETKQVIDAMAIHKLNILHWHLVDDQSWCLEITNYPNLTGVSSFRNGIDYGLPPRSTSATNSSGQYGGFYTQNDAREIVAYAADRHITVVPEIEMPCHSTPGLYAYPQFGCGNNGLSYVRDYPNINYGIDLYSLGTPGTMAFLQQVLKEVMQIFPGKYIHCGGDEVVSSGDTQWNSYAADVSNMASLGITPNGTLSIVQYQHWFSTNMATFVQTNGRTMIAWTEFENGGVVTNAALMDWETGTSSQAVNAATNGAKVVMCPDSNWYINYLESANVNYEPPFIVGGAPAFSSLQNVYNYNPIPAALPAAFQTNIIGGQCNLWAEYVPSFRNVMFKLFPRVCALAEATWTPVALKNYSSFTSRLTVHEQRFDAMGVNYNHEFVPQIGSWGPAVSASPATLTFDITTYVTSAGEVDVNFVGTNGTAGLQINSVSLLQNGVVVDTDTHYGVASKTISAYPMYIMRLPETKPGAAYQIQAVVTGYNGTSSSGTVYLPNWN